MLLPRVLTAIIGIPLLLFFIHLGSLPFLIFILGVASLALYEYGLILWLAGRAVQRIGLVVGGALIVLGVGLGVSPEPPGPPHLALFAITVSVSAVVLREILRRDHSLERAALTLFGVFFIGWTLAHLALIRDLRPHGERFCFFLFATVWVTDIAAFVSGKALGRRPLASVISPKKTWEGAVCGTLAALAFSGTLGRWLLAGSLGVWQTLWLGFLVSLLGQLSDLAESLIKRSAGVKDSSALLPGHGGVLDRFDSFLLTAPVIYYALALRLP